MDALAGAVQRGEGQEMGRLIDADRLKERWTIASPEPYNTDAAEVLASIEEAPTVDAVEVVRCGECRKWLPDSTCHTFINGKKHPIGCCQHTRRFTADCGFCSYGARRSDE